MKGEGNVEYAEPGSEGTTIEIYRPRRYRKDANPIRGRLNVGSDDTGAYEVVLNDGTQTFLSSCLILMAVVEPRVSVSLTLGKRMTVLTEVFLCSVRR